MCPHIEATFQLNMNVSKAYSALFSAIQELVRKSFQVEPLITAGDSVITVRFKVNPRVSHT